MRGRFEFEGVQPVSSQRKAAASVPIRASPMVGASLIRASDRCYSNPELSCPWIALPSMLFRT